MALKAGAFTYICPWNQEAGSVYCNARAQKWDAGCGTFDWWRAVWLASAGMSTCWWHLLRRHLSVQTNCTYNLLARTIKMSLLGEELRMRINRKENPKMGITWNLVCTTATSQKHTIMAVNAERTSSSRSLSAAQLRKIRKPLVERKRRERINESLQQMKTLLLREMNKDVSTNLLFWLLSLWKDKKNPYI